MAHEALRRQIDDKTKNKDMIYNKYFNQSDDKPKGLFYQYLELRDKTYFIQDLFSRFFSWIFGYQTEREKRHTYVANIESLFTAERYSELADLIRVGLHSFFSRRNPNESLRGLLSKFRGEMGAFEINSQTETSQKRSVEKKDGVENYTRQTLFSSAGGPSFAPERKDVAPGYMRIYVTNRAPCGGRLFIDVQPSDTVLSLKEKIFQRNRTPVDNQALYFNQCYMVDERTLAEYSIIPEAEIQQRPKTGDSRPMLRSP